MKILLASLALLTALNPALRAEPGNEIILNLESSADHPRNSEGAFATLRSGRILFCYSQFYGGHGDNSPAHLAEVHSDDDGQTWSAPRVMIENGANLNLMSVTFLRLASGKLALFYLIKQTALECHPVVQISGDDGATWSAPTSIIAAHGYFVLNNDRVIQTSTGRLIAPVAYQFLRQGPQDRGYPALAQWYYSDDEGATWKDADTEWTLPILSHTGLEEPGVVELADHSLYCWARTDQGAQYDMNSRDQGLTWSAPQPSTLISPASPASIKRLPGSDALLGIYNDHSGMFPLPAKPSQRTPLVAAVSVDGGKTWPARKILENDPVGRYCYTAILFKGDSVFIAYSAADALSPHFGRLRLRRLARSWLPALPRP